jgi:hypothetical protein
MEFGILSVTNQVTMSLAYMFRKIQGSRSGMQLIVGSHEVRRSLGARSFDDMHNILLGPQVSSDQRHDIQLANRVVT